jgi:RNA-directed DNA polymerase
MWTACEVARWVKGTTSSYAWATQAGLSRLGSNKTLTSSVLVVFGSRRAMTASSLPLLWDVVRLHHRQRCAQKPSPIAGAKLFTRDARRELYDIFGNIVGSVISPLLANLFLHDAFDRWRQRHYPHIPFERFADDAICHGASEAQAQELRTALARRFADCGVERHPQKTKIVYCKDDDRRGTDPEEHCDFLGYTCRPRRSKNRWGKYVVNFSPGVSDAAAKAIRRALRQWQLRCRVDKQLDDLARMFNPMIRGWRTYDTGDDKSALYPTLQHLDRPLARWAMAKDKRVRRHRRRAEQWLRRVARRQPGLVAHWRLLQAGAGR